MTLPNLDIWQQIVDGKGYPTLPFHVWWQEFVKSQNSTNTSLQEQISTITGLDTEVTTALAAADDSILVTSGTVGATLTGTDAGADATVSVSAHIRVYGNGSTVSVSLGSVTGLAFSTEYHIYYDQPLRTGGAVTYQATTSKVTACQTGDRHFVGTVTTPANGAADTTGVTPDPPGFGYLPGTSGGGGGGTVTSVSGAGTVAGLTLTGTVTGAGSITLGGSLSTTSSAISDFNSAVRAQTEAELIAGTNITITPASSGATRTLTIAATGGGLAGTFAATVPTARYEWEETLAATGVTGSSKIFLTLAPTLDSDENTIEMLGVSAMAGTPGTNTITVSLSFSEPTVGPIKLNWSAI